MDVMAMVTPIVPPRISVVPMALHKQSPRTYVEYLLPARIWGTWWTTPPTVESVRPKELKSVPTLRMIEDGVLAVIGGVAGARYQVNVGDQYFQVRVTAK